MDMRCHNVLEEKMCNELELIKGKYMQDPSKEMSTQDLEKIDKLYHALKSQATWCAMKEAEEYGEEGGNSYSYAGSNQNGNSGYRGRAMNGRYVSRESANSYADGYANGYSEAMNQMNNGNGGNSGHYPMAPYMPRKW